MRIIPTVRSWLSQKLIPVVKTNGIKFYCPSPLTVWRAETLMTKEPETIEFIDSFVPKSVFWDIGANVGMYSLYAAYLGHRVEAFEPMLANLSVFQRNLELNEELLTKTWVSAQISIWPLALSDATRLGRLELSDSGSGTALHTFGRYGLQTAIGMRGDTVINTFMDEPSIHSPRLPDYIKLDVDGNEEQILKGMPGLLGRVKALQVEVNIEEPWVNERIEKFLAGYGLTLTRRAQSSMFRNSPYSKYWNWQFRRKADERKER